MELEHEGMSLIRNGHIRIPAELIHPNIYLVAEALNSSDTLSCAADLQGQTVVTA